MFVWMRPWSPQPERAAPLPPILGTQFWAFPACQVAFFLNFPSEDGLGPASVCLELEALPYTGQGRGPGRGAKKREPAALPPPWALSRQNLGPRRQASLKGATSLEPGVWPSLVLPPGLATKLPLNLAAGLSLGELGPQVLQPGCQYWTGTG